MKLLIIMITLTITKLTFGSDLTISTSITSPVSGCNLTNSEIVKITIINAATAPYSGTFDVSYVVNSVTTTESITVPILPTSATYIYEFTTHVDLSACAVHNFTIYVSDMSDTNPNNDTITASITNDCTPAPGTFSAPSNVCIGMNNGNIDLVGNSGQILDWENSIDNGLNWNSLMNSSSSQAYNNINVNTTYRVIFNGVYGICPNDTIYHNIQIDSLSNAGLLENDSTHCDTIFPTALHLNNYYGSTFNWFLSLNNGNSFSNYVNPYDTLTYYEIAQNFQFFATVKNGTCPADSSNVVNINYIPKSDAGTIQGLDSICTDIPYNTLEAIGTNGSLINWQFSIDGSNWTNLTGNNNPIQVNNPNITADYRVIYQTSTCPQDTSFFHLTVLDSSNAGQLNGQTSFCDTLNNGFIYSSNYQGNILSWISSIDNGVTYNAINNTNDTLFYANLKTTTAYAIIVQNEQCAPDTSSLINIEIIENLKAGEIIAPDSVCFMSPPLLLTLADYSDGNFWWEISLDSGQSWQNTQVNVPNYNFNTSTQTTHFRVVNTEMGCENDTAVHSIYIYNYPIITAHYDTITLGNSIQLNAENGFDYVWSPNLHIDNNLVYNPIVTPTSTTNYQATITGPGTCVYTADYHITVEIDLDIVVIHNLITPNGDGYNDFWIIEQIEFFEQNEVKVFNQYGQIVYQASPYLNNWDTDNLPNGTYFYTVQLAKDQPVLKGTFTILDQN